MKFQGIFVAAATPFDYSGALYRAKIQHNFEKWNRTSVAGFVVGSLTGEGPLLDDSERMELFRLAAPCIPVDRIFIADASAEGVHAAAKLARAAAEAGAKAVASRAPHEYPRSMSGEESAGLFFRSLADRSPVPVLIHNSPRPASIDLPPETVACLAQHPNIAGVIEGSMLCGRIARLRAAAPASFAILAAAESQVWDALKGGADGAALAFASAAPYVAIAIWEAFRRREDGAGADWQSRVAHPAMLVTEAYGVPGLKHAMDLNGYYGGPPRLPLIPVSDAARREIEDAFRDLKG